MVRKHLQASEKKEFNIVLDESEQTALDAIDLELMRGTHLFIVPETYHILRDYFGEKDQVIEFLKRVRVITSSRYYKRWARRLQEFGFTREDAHVLSFGTFGTDDEERFVGTDQVLTFDKPLVRLFQEKHARIQTRLNAMKREMDAPYDQAKLPSVRLLG